MAVGAHGDQVGAGFFREPHDGVRRFADQEHGLGRYAGLDETGPHTLEILAVFPHLPGFRKVQLVQVARDPTVGHVDEHQLALHQPSERLDVGEDRLVGAAVLERDQNFAVHRQSPR